MWNRIYNSIRFAVPVFLLCATLLSFNLNSANASNFFTNKISTVEGVNNFVASIYDTILNLFVRKTKEVYVPVPVYISDSILTPVSDVVVDETTRIYNNNLLSGGTQKEFVNNNVLNISSEGNSNSNDGKEYVEMEFFQNQVETIFNSIYNSTTANIDSHTETEIHGGGSSGISFATVDFGGTGISTVPNYGELLMGDGLGGYSLVATSSLGLLGGGGSSQWTTSGSDIYYTTGSVGIGTTTPGANLDVNGTTRLGGPTVGVYPALVLNNKNADASGVGAGLQFKNRNDASNYMGGIQTIYRGGITSALTMMDFFAGGDSVTPKMTLGGSGNLGIGTTSPFTTLSVVGDAWFESGSTKITVKNSANSVKTEYASNSIQSYNSNLFINAAGNNVLFSASSNIGVGSTTPFSKFSIENLGSGNSFQVSDQALDTTPFVIDNAGNVGIGTTTPGVARTVIEGNSNILSVLGLSNSSNTANSRTYLNFYDNTAENAAAIGSAREASGTDWGLIFRTGSGSSSSGPSDRVYISAAGNVGIATTSPVALLSLGNGSGSPGTTPALGINFGDPTANLYRLASGMIRTDGALAVGGNLNMYYGNQLLINKAGNNWLNFATRDTTGPEAVYNLANIGTITASGTVTLNGLTSSATGNALCITSAKELTDSGGSSCTPSSIRFKENVTTLNPGYAMDTLSKLKVVHFDYKEKQPYETNHSYGLIAEEVANIDNNLVDYGYDGLPVSLHFEKITGLLVQAVQEQKAQIEEIKSQAFLDKIIKGVADSFASVVVRMQTAFVGELHVQEKLCVDDVCINKDQLKIILMNSGGTRYIPDTNPQPVITNNNNTNNSTASSTTEETTPPQASTTPQVQTPSEQPSTEPTNTPEQTTTTPPVEPVVEVTTPNPEPVTPPVVEPAPAPEPAPISSPEPAPTEGQ